MSGNQSLECSPVLRYDWVINDFENWAVAREVTQVTVSPKFFVDGFPFGLSCETNPAFPNLVYFWLRNYSKKPIDVALFSLHLVGQDRSKEELCSKADMSFQNGKMFLLNGSISDASLSISEIEPKFLPGGTLRIRCHLELKSKAPVPLESPSLVDDLRREIQTREFSDFTLVSSGQEFRVQRLLLASRSPVFRAMFEGKGFEEAKTGRAVVEDVDPETLEALIKFAQTDQVEDADLTTDLLAAADKYDMKVLFDKCEMNLGKSLSVGKVAEYFLVAYLHNAEKLKAFAMKFMADNFAAVKITEGFRMIVDAHPQALVELLKFKF